MTPEAAAILDHIVILVPYPTLLNLPTWLTNAFIISPGGRYADGVIENKLILLSDGVYLEIIAFVPGKEIERARHCWGQGREGTIIDWASTLHTEKDLEIVRDRVKSTGVGFEYEKAIQGGRTRPDGVELEWVTSSCSLRGTTRGPLWARSYRFGALIALREACGCRIKWRPTRPHVILREQWALQI